MPHNAVKARVGAFAVLVALAASGVGYTHAPASGLARGNLPTPLISQQVCYIINGILYCPTTVDTSRVRMPPP